MWTLWVLSHQPVRLAFCSTAPQPRAGPAQEPGNGTVIHLWHRTWIVRSLLCVVREDTRVTHLETRVPILMAPRTPNGEGSSPEHTALC